MAPFTISLGSKLPSFELLATDGKVYKDLDFLASKVLVVFFTCNHCPYVIQSNPLTAASAKRFAKQGVQFVGINSNSANTYKEDSFEYMVEEMRLHHFPWIYLHDPSQEIARKFGALRTPHFFIFDEERKLIYSGRGVDSPKVPQNVTINNLDLALEEHLSGRPLSTPLTNPIGCNVKWEGKDPHYMPPEACDLV
jgi:peroxiredoxin